VSAALDGSTEVPRSLRLVDELRRESNGSGAARKDLIKEALQ